MLNDEIKNNLKVYIAEREPNFARLIGSGLRGAGLEKVEWIEDQFKLRFKLKDKLSAPFMLMLDSEFLGTDTISFIKQIRMGELCDDPFILVFCTVSNPTMDRIQKLSVSGVDEVFTKPYAAKSITDRLQNMVGGRKPFVVTHDYVGPDRRVLLERNEVEAQSDNPLDIKHTEVPNIIRLMARKEYNISEYKAEKEKSQKTINIERIASFMFQIAFNATVVCMLRSNTEQTHLCATHFRQVGEYCEDTLDMCVIHIPGNRTIPNSVTPVQGLFKNLEFENTTQEQCDSLSKAAQTAFCTIHPKIDPQLIITNIKKSAEGYLSRTLMTKRH